MTLTILHIDFELFCPHKGSARRFNLRLQVASDGELMVASASALVDLLCCIASRGLVSKSSQRISRVVLETGVQCEDHR